MKNCKTACFAICAKGACTIAGLKNLYAEPVQLAAMNRMNFEDLGV